VSKHFPIVAVTGSTGAGTSAIRPLFAGLFEELSLNAVFVEGDSFHAYDREQMRQAMERARIRGENFSHFGPTANHLDRLETLFREYGKRGGGQIRRYLHTESEAAAHGQSIGTFTPWERVPTGTDLLFYEGLHGGVVTDEVNVAQHVDLLIGMTPIVNLEWIQKIKRDIDERGYQTDEVTKTILRRMPDYVNYITPQFSRTDLNFQRVPLVDTSNPFDSREIPRAEESLVVIHMARHTRVRVDFAPLKQEIEGAFTSRSDTLVVPGAHMFRAMELILRPALMRLAARRQTE
jgi:phosphoribulokinase